MGKAHRGFNCLIKTVVALNVDIIFKAGLDINIDDKNGQNDNNDLDCIKVQRDRYSYSRFISGWLFRF